MCSICGNIDSDIICGICKDEKRDKATICVVEDISDLWALERSSNFKGRYHILGGVIECTGPEIITFKELLENITTNKVTEVILALQQQLQDKQLVFILLIC